MDEKLNGVVLSAVSVGECDKILNIFTLEKGTVSAKIKGVKKAGAKLKFASEPFCFAEFVFSVRGDKRTVTGASLTDSFYPLRSDITRFYCGGVVLEYVKKFAKENIVSADLFLSVVNALKTLAYGNGEPRSALVGFFLNALKISGYGLDLSGCADCGKIPDGRIYFDWSRGGFLCEDCFDGSGREINLSTFLSLRAVERGEDIDDFGAIKCLKLIEFYLAVKPEETLNSLKQLLDFCKVIPNG